MNSVSFEEFSDWIGQALKKELEGRGIQGDIHYEDMRKIGSSYHGMSIYQGDSTVSPVFNLDSLYNDYLHERPIQVERMADYVENAIGMSNIKEGLVDYDHVKDSLFIRLSNGDYNRDLLSDIPYTRVEDLIVTYHIRIESPDGEMSAMINNHMLESYGVDLEQLHEDALSNSMKIYPARLMTMQEAMFGEIEKDMRAQGVPEDEIRRTKESMPVMADPAMYVVTNVDVHDGAASILYPGVMDQAAEKLGENFFILPSSRHEVILVPSDMGTSYRDLEDMVKQVNDTQVAPEDRLSDHVYHYEHGGKGLELASAFAKRQHQKEHKKAVGMEL